MFRAYSIKYFKSDYFPSLSHKYSNALFSPGWVSGGLTLPIIHCSSCSNWVITSGLHSWCPVQEENVYLRILHREQKSQNSFPNFFIFRVFGFGKGRLLRQQNKATHLRVNTFHQRRKQETEVSCLHNWLAFFHPGLMLSNCGAEEDSWESLGLQGNQTSQS